MEEHIPHMPNDVTHINDGIILHYAPKHMKIRVNAHQVIILFPREVTHLNEVRSLLDFHHHIIDLMFILRNINTIRSINQNTS